MKIGLRSCCLEPVNEECSRAMSRPARTRTRFRMPGRIHRTDSRSGHRCRDHAVGATGCNARIRAPLASVRFPRIHEGSYRIVPKSARPTASLPERETQAAGPEFLDAAQRDRIASFCRDRLRLGLTLLPHRKTDLAERPDTSRELRKIHAERCRKSRRYHGCKQWDR